MSVEEDTELRELVAQTLETNGCLAKIRAQLRASIFLALDDDEQLQKKEPFLNKKVKEHLESQQGKLMFCLVREFLEYFDLEFTISVYEPETYTGSQYYYEGRSKIVQESKIQQLDDKSTTPLLLQLIQIAQSRTSHDNSSDSVNTKENDLTNSDKTPDATDISIYNNDKSVSERDHRTVTSKKSTATNKLNETFDLSLSNQISLKHETVVLKNNFTNVQDENKEVSEVVPIVSRLKEDPLEKDDTFEGTSSIAEDSVRESAQDESVRLEKSETDKFKPEQIGSDSEISPPVVKDGGKFSKFDSSFEKLKLSPQKSEKLKTKSSLSSLSDLPPLPIMNKPRCNDMLLPSLYSKEFKEKSNSKDIDKMFDFNSLDNYEEDFMSGSEVDLVDVSTSNRMLEIEKSVKLNSEIDDAVNSNCFNKSREVNDSGGSSITSEDFESNSNVEDILNST